MTKRIVLAAMICGAAPLAAQEAPADTGRVYAIAEVTTPPRATNAAELREALQAGYPPALQAAGRSGSVEVEIVVGTDGGTRDLRVVRSDDPGFDSATVAALRVLRFTPASLEGRPVAVRVTLPVRWEPAPPEPADEPPLAAEEADGDTAYTYGLSEVTTPPRLRNPSLMARELQRHYPPRLRDSRQPGRVLARFRVAADGSVSRVTIVRSSHIDFNEATIQALQNVRFAPARLAGRPVAAWVDQPIEWTVAMPGGSWEQSP